FSGTQGQCRTRLWLYYGEISGLARRSCLSAAPAGREASFTAQVAQHAFFADFLARARKLVARRGESRPAALKKEKKAAIDTKAAQRA
ncbi:hypothetical protein, partial [Comamonas denitrificans]|uniref:hypothetical protein n=1 Tax=Comamonas denitrificans TaxID=117506 RepID=UPI00361C614D